MQSRIIVVLIFFVFTTILIAEPGNVDSYKDFTTCPFGTIYQEDSGFDYESNSLREVIDYDSSWVSFEGNWPFGYCYSISACEAEDLIFIGSGGGVFVTDVSDPATPQILSEVRARALVDGSYYDASTQRLYLAAYFSGVEIWDLTDLENPVFMSRCPTEPYPRAGIYVSGDYIFAATVSNGLRVLDASDPYNPYEVTSITLGSSFWNMAAYGNYLYITSSTSGLKVVDISDPLNPDLAASFPTAKGGISISGNYAYFAENGFGLRILDISDPLNPTEVGTCGYTDYPDKITVCGDYAYLVGNQCGLLAFDVSDPANPFLAGSHADYFQYVTSCNGYVYVTDEVDGFYTFDVSDPTSMQVTDNFELAGFAADVAVSGNYLYTGSSGFRVLDITDPSYPVQVGYADISGGCVAAGETHIVYCPKSMGSSNSVHFMNVDDPANPYSEGSYLCPVMSYDLAVQDNIALVACWWDGMRIIDFSNPANPVMLAQVLGWTNGAIPGEEYCFAQAVDIEGNYAYILDYGPFPDEDTFGLYIVDISIPNSPVIVNRYTNFTSHGYDLDVDGNYAYIADSYGGMEVIDISDPTNPVTLAYCAMEDAAQGIHVDGNYAYVANYILGGVQVFFVANPITPTLIGYYQRSGCFAMNVDSQNQYIFVADGVCGIQVYNNNLIQVGAQENTITPFKINAWNYPNPFNPSTKIEFNLNGELNEQVELSIFNVKGQKIKTFANLQISKLSNCQVVWDGTDEFNKSVSSGLYFYKIKVGEQSISRKMLLLK
jgi:hypothetical protein